MSLWRSQRHASGGLRLTGHIEATETNLGFKVPGKIRVIHFEEGQCLKAGQVVAELEADDLRQEVASAEARLKGRLDIEFDVGSIPVQSTGYLIGRDRVVLALNAADLLVGASSAETFGQVFAEAAACGVPAVAFHVTGVKDAVIDGITGMAVERRSAEALAERVRVAVAAKGGLLDDLASWRRIYAENEWSLEAGYGTVFAALRRHPSFESFGISHRIHFSRPASIEVPVEIQRRLGFRWPAFPISRVPIRRIIRCRFTGATARRANFD